MCLTQGSLYQGVFATPCLYLQEGTYLSRVGYSISRFLREVRIVDKEPVLALYE